VNFLHPLDRSLTVGGLRLHLFDWWAVVRAITPPTLVLRGEHSRVLDRGVAERMAGELPQGRLVEIPRAVHTLHEDNPEAVLAALKDFLDF